MSLSHLLSHELAVERHEEYRRQAERERFVAQVKSNRSGESHRGLRRQVGTAIVRAGERIQGVQRPDPAGVLPTAASLRTAR